MTYVIVEIAFGVDPYDDTTLDDPTNWAVVSDSDVRSGSYETSTRSDLFAVFSAGNAVITLDNRLRTYDPDYAAGTHFGDFLRYTPVRIIGKHSPGNATFADASDTWTLASHSLKINDRVQFSAAGAEPSTYAADTDYFVVTVPTSSTFQLSATKGGSVLAGAGSDSTGTWTLQIFATQFYGYALGFTPLHDNSQDSTTLLEATDDIGVLAQHDLDQITAAHESDTAGQRIARVLDDIGQPSAYRSLDAGVTLSETTFGTNSLRHCQLVAISDAGVFYAQRDGTITYDNQSSLTDDRQVNSQVTLTGSSDPKAVALARAGMGAGFRDLVRLSSDRKVTDADGNVLNGSLQEVDNSAVNRPPSVYQKTNLFMRTDGMALLTAQFYADLFGTEDPHVNRAEFTYNTVNDETFNSELFLRKIRDRVTVTFDPAGPSPDVSNECFIDGISGSFAGGVWNGSWTLSSADAYDDNLAAAPSTWLILDSASQGILDTNRMGY